MARGLTLVLGATLACSASFGCNFFVEPKPDVEHPQEFDLEGITHEFDKDHQYRRRWLQTVVELRNLL